MPKPTKIFVALVVILLIVGGVYLYVNSPKKVAEEIILPNRRLCETTSSGWSCNKSYFKRDCLEQGGRWGCSSNRWAPCREYRCAFPAGDVGIPCTDSSQCERNCVVSREYVYRNYPEREEYQNINCKIGACKGTCGEYFGEEDFILRGGVIYDMNVVDY